MIATQTSKQNEIPIIKPQLNCFPAGPRSPAISNSSLIILLFMHLVFPVYVFIVPAGLSEYFEHSLEALLSRFPDLSKYFARNIKLLAEFDHYQEHFMLD